MCAIAGIFAYRASAPAVSRVELCDIRDHMRARGPDGKGEWYGASERIGLAHRRLAIIDLSERGAQPMISADGRLAITFNGEIYNYKELKRDLEQQGRVFASDSDTEVLLHLYAVKGEAMLRDLRGMFAFAIWDARDHSLFLARDAFGIKPLYYADDGKALRFASQVKALLQGNVDTAPDPAGHAGFFLWGSVPSPWTLYRGIRELPAGHSMRVETEGGVRLKRWHSVSEMIRNAEASPARGTRADAISAIAEAVRGGVAAHMIADVPVGVFLSSGLDSCMLASGASAIHPNVSAITLGFREFEHTVNDEVPLAREVARSLGLIHNVRTVSRDDFVGERAALLAAMDQPSIDGVNTWFVARAAAQSGLKVALSGLGGDELFASYPSFVDVPKMHRMAKPFGNFPKLGRAMRAVVATSTRRFASPKYASLLEYGGTFGGAYFLRRALLMPWELTQMLDADMAREGIKRLQVEDQLNSVVTGIRSDRGRVSALEMSMYMHNQLLRDTDWAGMAHSVELRVPFVDSKFLKEVLPWLAAFPSLTKAEIAVKTAPKLPASIWNRPKTGFSVPVRQWILTDLPNDTSRGLRGWAARVYNVQTSSDPVTTSTSEFVPKSKRRPATAVPRAPRVLISTIAPGSGGVHAMAEFVVQLLRDEGFEPVIAHYEPYSVSPALSAPSYKLLTNRIGTELRNSHRDCETHAIGAWLPELEFTHYFATKPWRHVMDSCDAFVAASGNNLAATSFYQTNRRCLSWVATDWEGDRADRVSRFSLLRRALDRAISAPVIRRLERQLLSVGTTVALSVHTREKLRRISPNLSAKILPVPVDTDWFHVCPSSTKPMRIGFAGRFDDPRKNIELLLGAFALLTKREPTSTLSLMGGSRSPFLDRHITRLNASDAITVAGRLSDEQYRAELQSLDVFVIPSHQEGLCIAALEAMACGVPVVSTRCGGPEEFVLQGVSGYVVGFGADEMARAIERIVNNRQLRATLSQGARQLVEQQYTVMQAKSVFMNSFFSVFPELRDRSNKVS